MPCRASAATAFSNAAIASSSLPWFFQLMPCL